MNWEEELEEYTNSREHIHSCAAHSEGQTCCLEKRWVRDFIGEKDNGMNYLTDRRFRYLDFDLLRDEENRQLEKWGIQTHTALEWLAFTTEELGELSQAITDYLYKRVTTPDNIVKEAIQVAMLAFKIALMADEQLEKRERNDFKTEDDSASQGS